MCRRVEIAFRLEPNKIVTNGGTFFIRAQPSIAWFDRLNDVFIRSNCFAAVE